jgi:hypothetical protein
MQRTQAASLLDTRGTHCGEKSMKYRLRSVVGVFVVAMIPTHATAATTSLDGGGAWTGIVSLSQYPCPFACSVTFNGYFTGSITALDASNNPMYNAIWAAGTTPNLQAGPLTYSESCGSIPFAPPQSGSATGSFTITGGLLKPASPNGSSIAQLTGSIALGRFDGVLLNITVSNVQLLDGNGTVLATAQTSGAAPGFFGWPIPTVPELMTNPLPPNCANEEAVSVAVLGSYVQPT